ncbi:MAG TPA: hypothetical protein VJP45_10445 [Candidatus Limnocylindria bacterium]|nr:hypothetical protein [Candidatus Limnocylindria bacterium]
MSGTRGPVGVDWDEQPLGLVPDSVLAYQNDVGITAVQKARLKRGIGAPVGAHMKLKVMPDHEVALLREFPGAPLHVAIHLALQQWAEASKI